MTQKGPITAHLCGWWLEAVSTPSAGGHPWGPPASTSVLVGGPSHLTGALAALAPQADFGIQRKPLFPLATGDQPGLLLNFPRKLSLPPCSAPLLTSVATPAASSQCEGAHTPEYCPLLPVAGLTGELWAGVGGSCCPQACSWKMGLEHGKFPPPHLWERQAPTYPQLPTAPHTCSDWPLQRFPGKLI